MDDLKARSAIPHLVYEIAMLEKTSDWLSRNPTNNEGQLDLFNLTDDQAIRCAMLESFLVHARLLKEFFFGGTRHPDVEKPPMGDDIRAQQYFMNPADWPPPGVIFTPQLQEFIDYANKLLMHLTYTRVGQNFAWSHKAAYNEINGYIEKFRTMTELKLRRE